jgi:hypothetical protein
MRFTAGLVAGLAVGYYLGSKAGRERYEQIEEWLDRVRGTDTYRDAMSRLEQLYEQGRLGSEPMLDLRTMEFEEPPA